MGRPSGVVNAWVLARSDRQRSWRFFAEALARPPRRPGRHHCRGHPPGRHGRHGRPRPALLHRPGDPRGRALLNPSLPEELDGLAPTSATAGNWGINLHLTPDRLRVSVPASCAALVRIGVKGEVVELAPGTNREFPP